jgi:hypothetical protein
MIHFGVGAANIIVGIVYLSVGAMTIVEMTRRNGRKGFSHFGFAWIAMLFTCGAHHWVHGLHATFEGRHAGWLDLVAVMVGLPAGLLWFGLRIEAFRGGRGDRFVPGTPVWVGLTPTFIGIYVTALGAGALALLGSPDFSQLPLVIPNVILVFLYGSVAYLMASTQVANRRPLGGWSLSGIALAIAFATCALMHAVYVVSALAGVYGPDIHGLGIDWLSVPAAAYFLWVVYGLNRGTFRDWNGAPATLGAEQQVPVPSSA